MRSEEEIREMIKDCQKTLKSPDTFDEKDFMWVTVLNWVLENE